MRPSGSARTLLLTLLVAFASLTAPTAIAHGQPDDRSQPSVSDAAGLHMTSTRWVDSRLLEARFTTPALAQPVTVRVLLPRNYGRDTQRRFPVLYLLHGGGGDARYWTDQGAAEKIVGDAPVIVVMPDGGYGGWYANWFNSGLGGPPKWENFHIGQLVPWTDANFRTRAERSGRAIAGLSMGGFGAMSYAARHPELFTAAAAFSGAVDILNPLVGAVVTVSPLATLAPPTSVFGPPVLSGARWRAHNPTSLAARLHGIQLAFYTGDGRPGPYDPPVPDPAAIAQEIGVHQASQSFDRALSAAGVAHRFIDYGPGTHQTAYWRRDLSQELPHLMDAFNTDNH